MQWKSVGNHPKMVYELSDGDEVVLSLEINYSVSAFRAECKSSKRVFFIDKEGFWKNRTVLKNEYGQTVGKLFYEKLYSDTGTVEIDSKKYKYKYRNNPMAELVFFNENINVPIVSCGLAPAGNGHTKVRLSKDKNFPDPDLLYQLFALSWYLFLPIAQENVMDFTAFTMAAVSA
jgi:hypothetical protein